MTLGETIRTVRSEKGMSQGDLADALDVSRQSVSKWETDASVPELDKLVKMCDLFGVSLDELVRGVKKEETLEPAEQPEPQQEPPVSPTWTEPEIHRTEPVKPPHQLAGIILLCTGAVITLLLTLMGSILGGLLYASPFLLCGLICLKCRRHVGLKCAWAVYFCVDLFMASATAVNRRVVFRTFNYAASDNYFILLLSWIMVLLLVGLIALTVFVHRKDELRSIRQVIPGLILLGASMLTAIPSQFIVYSLTSVMGSDRYHFIGGMLASISFITDWLEIAAVTSLLCVFCLWLKQRRHN